MVTCVSSRFFEVCSFADPREVAPALGLACRAADERDLLVAERCDCARDFPPCRVVARDFSPAAEPRPEGELSDLDEADRDVERFAFVRVLLPWEARPEVLEELDLVVVEREADDLPDDAPRLA